MSGSRLYPKVYNGREESGGYIGRNESRKSGQSPHYRGRIYLADFGWHWVSGWTRDTRTGEVISLSIKAMNDDEAKQYCAPRDVKKRERSHPEADDDDAPPEKSGGRDSGIPF